MKKRTTLSIFIILIFFIFTSFIIYAAFTYRSNIDSTVSNLEITTDGEANTEVSTSNTLSATFNSASEYTESTITITNNSDLPFSYIIGLTQINEATGLENAILVYYNDTFVGTVADFYSGTLNNYEIVYLQSEETIVLPNTTKSIKIKFELHNALEEEISGLSFGFKLSCLAKTIDNNTYSIVSTPEELHEALMSVNSGMNKTIILSNDIILNESLIISNNCVIDLNGNNIIFSGNNIEINETSSVKLINSSNNELNIDDTEGTFVINSSNAFLDISDSISSFKNIDIIAFSFDKLMEIIENNLINQNGILSGSDESIDLFKKNKDYLKLINITTLSEIDYSSGVVSKAISTENTYVSKITFDYQSNTKVLEVIIYGNQNIILDENEISIIDYLVDTELLHIKEYEKNDNPEMQKYLGSDIFLPTSIKKYNATIIWESSDVSYMSNDGKIPSGTEGEVTLIAKIKINQKVYHKEFIICIAKETNAQKLERLINLLDIRFTSIYPDHDEVNDIISQYILPGTDSSKDNYYTNFGIEDIGLTGLEYSIDTNFNYMSILSSSNTLKLDTITFDKYAEVKVIGWFGQKSEEGIIKVSIDLSSNDELLSEVLEQAQLHLNNVSVLQNMINTRKTGLGNEKGDFDLLLEYNGFEIQYSKPENSSEQAYDLDANGQKIIIHPEYFRNYDTTLEIYAKVLVNDVEAQNGTLSFEIPGAIHYLPDTYEGNDVEQSFNDERLFYNLKLQTMIQSLEEDDISVDVPNTYDGIKAIFAENNCEKELDHGNYILLYDIERCHTLIIEADKENVSIDYQIFNDMDTLIDWAISSNNTSVTSLELNRINISDTYDWIISDASTITDAEEMIVLKYLSKYPYFEAFWNNCLYGYELKDNILSNTDKNELEAILVDSIYSSLIEWSTIKTNSSVNTYLLSKNLVLSDDIASVIGEYEADNLESISKIEEEAILRYCWYCGYCEDGYYDVWLEYVNYSDQEISYINTNDTIVKWEGVDLVTLLYDDTIMYNKLYEWINLYEGDTLKAYGDFINDKQLNQYYSIVFDEYTSKSAQRIKTWLGSYINSFGDSNDSSEQYEREIFSSFFINNGYMTQEYWDNTFMNQENNYITIASADTSLFGSDKKYTYISDEGYSQLEELLKYKNDATNYASKELSTIINWATSSSRSSLLSLATLNTNPVKKSRLENLGLSYNDVYNDGNENFISCPEYEVIRNYLINNYSNQIYSISNDESSEEKRIAYIDKTLKLFLDMNGEDILSINAKSILSQIVTESRNVDLDEFYTFIAWTQEENIISSKNINGNIYNSDGLATISNEEKSALLEYVDSSILDIFSSKLDEVLNLITPKLSTFNVEYNKYKSEISIKNLDGNSYNSYYYFTINQMTDDTVLEGLKEYKNVDNIHFIGKKDYSIFANSLDLDYSIKANEAFGICISSMSSLVTLDFRYCNLATVSGISTIPSLEYIDLKGNSKITSIVEISKISSEGKLRYLNIYDIFTDEELIYQESLLKIIYLNYYDNNNSVSPKIVYNKDQRELYYHPLEVISYGLSLLYLLKDIQVINSTYIQLPKNIYDYVSGVQNKYVITWSVISGPLSFEITQSGYYRLRRTSTSSGFAIVDAKITYDGKSYVRHFNIELPKLGGSS